ncbi:DUF2508 family protein [Jeotgalibaca caeni]|uniref:DUF2508 family protein n=1 Tax=Jeotgalibaca caeni TaxID=3028623 RepID=UPI00237D9573|nr:DUF2508 family protein [Jeotgalibaca caeni]MDE1549862.1 DUF2508 family protein [Jeotgalibaca caeni]
MIFQLGRTNRKKVPTKLVLDQQLAETIQSVYRQSQLLQELERNAYEVPEELYIRAKLERAKYLYLMKEARVRNLSSDIDAPKKAKPHYLKKRKYQKDHLFMDK